MRQIRRLRFTLRVTVAMLTPKRGHDGGSDLRRSRLEIRREELAHACRPAKELGYPGAVGDARGAVSRPALGAGGFERGGRARRLWRSGMGGRRRPFRLVLS